MSTLSKIKLKEIMHAMPHILTSSLEDLDVIAMTSLKMSEECQKHESMYGIKVYQHCDLR